MTRGFVVSSEIKMTPGSEMKLLTYTLYGWTLKKRKAEEKKSGKEHSVRTQPSGTSFESEEEGNEPRKWLALGGGKVKETDPFESIHSGISC